jgi:hypothetical protein
MEAYVSILSIRIGLNSRMVENTTDAEATADIVDETTTATDAESND